MCPYSFFVRSAICKDELTAIKENLPEELTVEVDMVFHKRLEFNFHSADYHAMLETTTGLRTAADYLVKVHYTIETHICTHKLLYIVCVALSLLA